MILQHLNISYKHDYLKIKTFIYQNIHYSIIMNCPVCGCDDMLHRGLNGGMICDECGWLSPREQQNTNPVPTKSTNDNSRTIIMRALRYLSSVCDGAIAQDGVGFNGTDSAFGKSLAAQDHLSYNQYVSAAKMLLKYQKQLASEGIDISSVKLEAEEKKEIPEIDLEAFLKAIVWTEKKVRSKKDGKLWLIKEAEAPTNFWDVWNAKKDILKAIGISCPKKDEETGLWGKTIKIFKEIKEDPAKVLPAEKPVEKTHFDESKLYDYQIPHAKLLIGSFKKHLGVLDASDTGTGKTYTGLATCMEYEYKPLIICPLRVIPQWKKACAHFGIKPLAIVNYELIRTGKLFIDRPKKRGKGHIRENVESKFLTVTENVNRKTKWDSKYIMKWNLPSDALVIFDEAHRCKNKGTYNTQMLVNAREQRVRILMLSATIAENPLRLQAVGFALGFYEKIHYFYSWAGNYGCHKEVVNRMGQEVWVFDGNRNHIEKLHHLIFPEFGSRMKISEIPSFPENQVIAECYDMNSDADKIASMQEELDKLDNAKKDIDETALTDYQKEKQKQELLKIPTLVEMAEDLVESGNSVVIFVNYTQSVEALQERLNTICSIYGKNGAQTDEIHRVNFQEDKERIIICNIQAAREGIDLNDIHGKYPRVSLISPCDSAQYLKQALGRIHRINSKSKSVQRLVYCAGTIEEKIAKRLNEKLKNIETLNDGDLDARNYLEV
jgi:superfamily II DNA or RNA helicase